MLCCDVDLALDEATSVMRYMETARLSAVSTEHLKSTWNHGIPLFLDWHVRGSHVNGSYLYCSLRITLLLIPSINDIFHGQDVECRVYIAACPTPQSEPFIRRHLLQMIYSTRATIARQPVNMLIVLGSSFSHFNNTLSKFALLQASGFELPVFLYSSNLLHYMGVLLVCFNN